MEIIHRSILASKWQDTKQTDSVMLDGIQHGFIEQTFRIDDEIIFFRDFYDKFLEPTQLFFPWRHNIYLIIKVDPNFHVIVKGGYPFLIF